MCVCESDRFTQYSPVKHWIHSKSISLPSPPNWPVSATGGSGTLSNVHHSRILVINMHVVRGHISYAHTPPNEKNTLWYHQHTDQFQ